MDARLKETVRIRAGLRCEYCHLPEAIAELPFQFDHVIAEQHGGVATEDNLALSCVRCNRCKGPNLSGIDPESGRLSGRTAIGRTTIAVLQINHPEAKNQRVDLLMEGISF